MNTLFLYIFFQINLFLNESFGVYLRRINTYFIIIIVSTFMYTYITALGRKLFDFVCCNEMYTYIIYIILF